MQRCSISAVRGYSAWSMKLRCRFVGDDLLRLRLHPGRHESGQIPSRVTLEGEVLGDQPQRVLGRHPGLWELPTRNLLSDESVAEQRHVGGRRLGRVGHHVAFHSDQNRLWTIADLTEPTSVTATSLTERAQRSHHGNANAPRRTRSSPESGDRTGKWCSGLPDLDLGTVTARASQAGIAGHERALEGFGQGHVRSVVSREVMAQLERPPPKSVFSGPPLDLEIVEVGQQIFGALGAQITAERESAYRGHDFEVNQGRSVQLIPGEVGPEFLGSFDCSQSVDEGRTVHNNHALDRRRSSASRLDRAALTESSADAFARSVRRAARSRTSATEGLATSRLMRPSK